jgi:ATP adenylyltransferase
MAYIAGESRPPTADASQCPFCLAPDNPDGLVVARGQGVFAVLNLYPYNPGHLLICPYRHVADLTDLSEAELSELGAMTVQAMRTLRAVSGPAGFNLGVNQGAVAGAGIQAHVHQHVVPRWSGDANFFPIVARTRALPELLAQTRERLAAAWVSQDAASSGGSRNEEGTGC